MTLANKITLLRLGLTLVYLVVLHFLLGMQENTLLIDACTATLVICAVLDVVDGAVARHTGTITTFGRIMDPLADKILICGTFVFLVGFEKMDGIVELWVPVVLIVREFAVHAVRVDLEGRGTAFGASLWGKQKTFLQTVAALGCLLYISHLSELESAASWKLVILVCVGLAVASTALSGIIYAVGAARALRSQGN